MFELLLQALHLHINLSQLVHNFRDRSQLVKWHQLRVGVCPFVAGVNIETVSRTCTVQHLKAAVDDRHVLRDSASLGAVAVEFLIERVVYSAPHSVLSSLLVPHGVHPRSERGLLKLLDLPFNL